MGFKVLWLVDNFEQIHLVAFMLQSALPSCPRDLVLPTTHRQNETSGRRKGSASVKLFFENFVLVLGEFRNWQPFPCSL